MFTKTFASVLENSSGDGLFSTNSVAVSLRLQVSGFLHMRKISPPEGNKFSSSLLLGAESKEDSKWRPVLHETACDCEVEDTSPTREAVCVHFSS